MKYLLLLAFLLCGCGQTLEQSQSLTLPPEEVEATPLPDRTFLASNPQFTALVFKPNADYNGVNPPVTAASSFSGTIVVDSGSNNLVRFALNEGARTLSFGVLAGSDPLVPGQVYSPFFNDLGPGSFLNLEDLTSGRKSWLQNAATGGGLTIVSLSDTQIEIDFNFTNIQPNFRQGSGNALGLFDVSGHLTADLTQI
ncbi:hypothetical protein JST97_02505 [bacterium]|nr:hypothetical protein [bacterium]